MTDYCITAVRRANKDDKRVSHVNLWKYVFVEDKKKYMWHPLGAQSTAEVVKLLADGHRVRSGKENDTSISPGDEIEFVLRIAGNDERVKIGDMPDF